MNMNEFLVEAANQSRKARYESIAKTLDRAVISKKLDSRMKRQLQRLNDLCVLAAHHIDDMAEAATQAKTFSKDDDARKEVSFLTDETEKLCSLADKKIMRMKPVLSSMNIFI